MIVEAPFWPKLLNGDKLIPKNQTVVFPEIKIAPELLQDGNELTFAQEYKSVEKRIEEFYLDQQPLATEGRVHIPLRLTEGVRLPTESIRILGVNSKDLGEEVEGTVVVSTEIYRSETLTGMEYRLSVKKDDTLSEIIFLLANGTCIKKFENVDKSQEVSVNTPPEEALRELRNILVSLKWSSLARRSRSDTA